MTSYLIRLGLIIVGIPIVWMLLHSIAVLPDAATAVIVSIVQLARALDSVFPAVLTLNLLVYFIIPVETTILMIKLVRWVWIKMTPPAE